MNETSTNKHRKICFLIIFSGLFIGACTFFTLKTFGVNSTKDDVLKDHLTNWNQSVDDLNKKIEAYDLNKEIKQLSEEFENLEKNKEMAPKSE